MTEWFRCLADVPGVGYRGDSEVRRTTLAGHDAVPQRISYVVDGEQHESLMWTTKDGTTSASPAACHASSYQAARPEQPVDEQVQRLAEVLELPGILSDYHFAIQHCAEVLWKRRRHDPAVLPDLERLCWLDIALIKAQPATITYERQGKQDFFRVLAFGYLIDLYDQNGLLADALVVAQHADRFGQAVDIDDLQLRMAQVGAETR